jgi:2-oxoisovalerate dehydrogenase E1 component alpha subunit
LAEARAKDPIVSFANYLKEVGVLTDALDEDIQARVMKQVNEATDYAEKAPYAEPEHALRYVYAEE